MLKSLEIDIVRAQTAGQFPDPFHWIQVGTVGRQEIQTQDTTMFVEPRSQGSCMMPTGIVEYHYQLASMASPAQQAAQENLKALRVESFHWHCHHSAIGRANRTKNG
jgi:hypothetical protein